VAHFFLSLDRFLPQIDMGEWASQIWKATAISLFYHCLVAVPEDLRLDNDPIALAAVYTRLK
jgi:hypothetical protein